MYLTRQQRRIILEARQQMQAGERRLLQEKAANYYNLLNEAGFFKTAQRAYNAVKGAAGRAGRAVTGGTTYQDLEYNTADAQQDRGNQYAQEDQIDATAAALKTSINTVNQAKKKFQSANMVQPIATGALLDKYIEALVALYTANKVAIEKDDGSNAELIRQVQPLYNDAQELLKDIASNASQADAALKKGIPTNSKLIARVPDAPLPVANPPGPAPTVQEALRRQRLARRS